MMTEMHKSALCEECGVVVEVAVDTATGAYLMTIPTRCASRCESLMLKRFGLVKIEHTEWPRS